MGDHRSTFWSTDPYGILEWCIGANGDFVCFDFCADPDMPGNIVIHSVLNSDTGSLIETFAEVSVPAEKAVAAAEGMIGDALDWCAENDVDVFQDEETERENTAARRSLLHDIDELVVTMMESPILQRECDALTINRRSVLNILSHYRDMYNDERAELIRDAEQFKARGLEDWADERFAALGTRIDTIDALKEEILCLVPNDDDDGRCV